MNPHIINNLDFAKKNNTLSGSLTAIECTRLSELLGKHDQPSLQIQYTILGRTDGVVHPSLDLMIEAELHLICQRCLKPMHHKMALNFIYAICDNAEVQDSNDDDTDFIDPDRAMNLIDLIEDEVIAALPIAPKHDEICSDLQTYSAQKESPFAVLKALKKK